jgi:hypothetical protein
MVWERTNLVGERLIRWQYAGSTGGFRLTGHLISGMET